MQPDEGIKYTIDTVAAGVTLGAMMDMVPTMAAVVSLVWAVIRVYETKTVQDLIAKWRNNRGRKPPE